MAYPKVSFTKIDIEENLNCLTWYCKKENSKDSPLDFYDLTMRLFPNLEGKLQDGMDFEEIYTVLDREVRPILEKNNQTNRDIEKYQRAWDAVSQNIMKTLEDELHTEWNKEDEITCRVGLFPVLSRDILGMTFDMNYNMSSSSVIATCIHELCHLLYFKKWRELYPNYSEEEFDTPHIAWYLSEAMIDPLINNDTFKKYTSDDLSAYTYFDEIVIDGKPITETLRDFMAKYPIESAIEKSYEFFQTHEKEIRGF